MWVNMNMNAFKYTVMAKQCYMKCQEIVWEEMRKCNCVGDSADVQEWQDSLGTQALIQLYNSPQLSMGQRYTRRREL